MKKRLRKISVYFLILLGIVLSNNVNLQAATTIVNDETSFRNALTDSNDTIEFGANITLSQEQYLSSSKVIDGKGFTLDTGTHAVHYNAGTGATLTVKNMTINSLYDFGPFPQEGTAYGLQQTFENVTMTGSQAFFNLTDTITLAGNVTISNNTDANGQVHNLVIQDGATINMSNTAQGYNLVFTKNVASFSVGNNVTFTMNGNYSSFNLENNTDITIGKNSTVVCNGKAGSDGSGLFRNIKVGQQSTLKLKKGALNAGVDFIKIAGNVNLELAANLNIETESSMHALYFADSTSKVNIDTGASFTLANGTGPLISNWGAFNQFNFKNIKFTTYKSFDHSLVGSTYAPATGNLVISTDLFAGNFIQSIATDNAAFNSAGTSIPINNIKRMEFTHYKDISLSANASITYDQFQNVSDAQFLSDIEATVNNMGTITSDFSSVNMSVPGTYTVTLQAIDAYGDTATKTVQVTITKVAPVLSANAYTTYEVGTSKTETEFLMDIGASLNQPGTISSTFENVNFNIVGVYPVVLSGVGTNGLNSNTITTYVGIKKANTIVNDTNKEMIDASEFTLNLSNVASADFTLLANVKGWDFTTGTNITVSMSSAKPTTAGIFPITFASASGTQITVNVTIIDDVAPTLTANSTVIYTVGSMPPTFEQFNIDCNAVLSEIGTLTYSLNTVNFNTVGVYPVNMYGQDTAGNTSNSVTINVIIDQTTSNINEINQELIDASDFNVHLSDVASADFVLLANAKAWSISDASIVNVTMTTNKPSSAGTFPVTFTTTKGTTITVEVTVLDNTNPILTADSSYEYLKGSSISEADFISDINAVLNEPGTIQTTFSNVDLNTVGVYPVVLNGEDSALNPSNTVTCYVIVKNINSTVDNNNKELLDATDFSINLSDIASADFVNLANAYAWDTTTANVVSVSLLGNKPTESGLVTFVTLKGTSITVNVTVIDNVEPSVISYDSLVIYNQNDNATESEFLLDANIIWSEQVSTTTTFDSIDTSIVGVYPVTITYQDSSGNSGVPIIVYVAIKGENSHVDTTNNEMINANSFTINLSEVTNADFVHLANAMAWNTTTGDNVAVVMEGSKPTTGGIKQITFTTALGTSTTIEVVIVDDIFPEIIINSSSVVYSLGSVPNENQFIIDIDVTTNKPGTIITTFNSTDLNNVGVYPVTIRLEDEIGNVSQPQTVMVAIKGGNSIINESNKEMIDAYPFSIHVTDLSSANFVTLAGAKAWSLTTGTRLPVTLVSPMPTKVGTYDIVFTTANGSEITIKVKVVDSMAINITVDSNSVRYLKNYKPSDTDILEKIGLKVSVTSKSRILAKAASIPSGVTVSIDRSKIDITKVGKYPMKITATDTQSKKSSSITIDYVVYENRPKIPISGASSNIVKILILLGMATSMILLYTYKKKEFEGLKF